MSSQLNLLLLVVAVFLEPCLWAQRFGGLAGEDKGSTRLPSSLHFPVTRAQFQAYKKVFLVDFAVVLASVEALLVALNLSLPVGAPIEFFNPNTLVQCF